MGTGGLTPRNGGNTEVQARIQGGTMPDPTYLTSKARDGSWPRAGLDLDSGTTWQSPGPGPGPGD